MGGKAPEGVTPSDQPPALNSVSLVRHHWIRALVAIGTATTIVVAVAMEWPASYRAAIIASLCVLLWLTGTLGSWVT